MSTEQIFAKLLAAIVIYYYSFILKSDQQIGNQQYFLKYLFIWLYWVSLAALRLFHCGMWDLVPQPGIELGSPVLGKWSRSH